METASRCVHNVLGKQLKKERNNEQNNTLLFGSEAAIQINRCWKKECKLMSAYEYTKQWRCWCRAVQARSDDALGAEQSRKIEWKNSREERVGSGDAISVLLCAATSTIQTRRMNKDFGTPFCRKCRIVTKISRDGWWWYIYCTN